MKYFCDKYGKECPNTTPQAQSYNCNAWDPREFLADKTCRHALTVDNMEMANQQWLAAQKIGPKKKRRIETPERPAPQPVIINKAGEIDAKQTAILQRLELMQRQTAAQEKIAALAERIAETFEKVEAEIRNIADHFGLQMAALIDTLEPVAKVFRDDDEAAADADDTCDNDCEHCDWATCPKEEARMSDDKYEIELRLSSRSLKKILKEYGTGKYCLIEDTPTFKRLMDRVLKKMKEAADERHS